MISHFYLSLVYLASCLLHFTFLLIFVTAFHFPITICHRISPSNYYLSQHFTFQLLLVTAFHFPITTCHSISLSYYYLSQHFTFLLLLVTAFHIPITTCYRYAWHGEDPKARTYGIKSEHLAYNGK